jgi:hypothetical protein
MGSVFIKMAGKQQASTVHVIDTYETVILNLKCLTRFLSNISDGLGTLLKWSKRDGFICKRSQSDLWCSVCAFPKGTNGQTWGMSQFSQNY